MSYEDNLGLNGYSFEPEYSEQEMEMLSPATSIVKASLPVHRVFS